MDAVRGLGRGLGFVLLLATLVAVPSAHAQFTLNGAPSWVPPGKAFGFNGNLQPTGEPLGSTLSIDAAQKGGATHWRFAMLWRNYELETTAANPIPPSFAHPVGSSTGSSETNRIDRFYLMSVNRGITPVLGIQNVPAWASTFYKCINNPVLNLDKTACPNNWRTNALVLYVHPDHHTAMVRFAEAVTRRYPLAVIEGTNEPDFSKQFQPQYHPPIAHVASQQCAMAGGVRLADPNRVILNSGLFVYDYGVELARSNAGKNCYTYFNVHYFRFTDLRNGKASGLEGQMNRWQAFLATIGHTRGMWVTETGMTDSVFYTDENFNPDAVRMGETIVSRAFPGWMKYLLNRSDIHGVLIQTLREGSYGEHSDHQGLGLLTAPNYQVKHPGGGEVARFCYLVLSAGNTYPGCEGYTLPPPPQPSPATFYKAPQLLWDKTSTGPGDEPAVFFLEQGHPAPNVTVIWYRCNALGLSCAPFQWDRSSYKLTSNDKFRTFKVSVTISNAQRSETAWTKLSPIVQ